MCCRNVLPQCAATVSCTSQHLCISITTLPNNTAEHTIDHPQPTAAIRRKTT
jgi:hypothetical protein